MASTPVTRGQVKNSTRIEEKGPGEARPGHWADIDITKLRHPDRDGLGIVEQCVQRLISHFAGPLYLLPITSPPSQLSLNLHLSG